VLTLKPLREIVLTLLIVSIGFSARLAAQGVTQPVRWDAKYTPVYFDDVETIGSALGPNFVLGTGGSLTASPAEVISGSESIKGAYSGTNTYTAYLQSNPAVLTFAPSRTYKVSFQYKILTPATNGFQVNFFSNTAAAQNNFLAGVTLTGGAGTAGTASFTNTLGAFTDYALFFGINGSGAISVDNIQVIDGATAQTIASESAEGVSPGVGPGLQLQMGASITSDPTLVIGGKASILLPSGGTQVGGALVTIPDAVPLAANTTYLVEFDYRILARGPGPVAIYPSFVPPGPYKQPQSVTMWALLQNAPASGHFSTGAMTNRAGAYVFSLFAAPGWSLVIDNIQVERQTPVPSTSVPSTWNELNRRPFPRLGNYQQGAPEHLVEFPQVEPPFTYTLDQIESRLAFADVIAGLAVNMQSGEPASLRRLRRLNPNVVILPYRISEEQNVDIASPVYSDIDPDYDFLAGFADAWYTKETSGNYVSDGLAIFTSLRKANLSPMCPLINGNTYTGYLLQWLNASVFTSGSWDGIFLDNLFGRINPHILNYDNPALLNYDWNLNGARDESPASSSDMTRQWAINFLTNLQGRTQGPQILMGNAGSLSELALAPYVNGYISECSNGQWNNTFRPTYSAAAWRQALNSYLTMQKQVRQPQTMLLESCGHTSIGVHTQQKVFATADDIYQERFSLGTALLGDGFFDYDLWDAASAPYWFDEYSVDANGTAVEDLTKKGYLGAALTGATELTIPGTLVYSQDFESGTPVLSATPANGAFVSKDPAQVISGAGSLVISNPDHTKSASFNAQLVISTGIAPGSPALIRLKWRVNQTLDGRLTIGIQGITPSDSVGPIGVVAGDAGSETIPIAAVDTGTLTLNFTLINGGGEVAIDDIEIYAGGIGPWRRDFENGFVLVNPFNQPHTFTAADLAGTLNRTGIHRIKGTQAPDINNGQPVTDSLTLAPFDAIILLADPVAAPGNFNYRISDRSGLSRVTTGANGSVQVGFARILPYQGTTPSGLAIFDFTQNGVLISEAAVPASPLIQSGRTYAEIGGPVDTGIAIANPTDQDATITFYYTDASGANILSGTTTLPANNQIAAFLDQAPFISSGTSPNLSSVRTFSFASSIPVGVIALRGYTNERGEFLMTTLPVMSLDSIATSSAAFEFPHYADGAGWTSTIVLINPTDSTISGTARFYSKGTASTPGAPVTLTANGSSAASFSYTIAPRSAFKLQTAGTGPGVQTGSVSITPASASVAPSGLVVFSFQNNGVRVSEAGVPALPASSAFHMYAESFGSIQTGIAISNPNSSNVTVTFDLTNLDGSPTGLSGTATIPATGQISLFLNQIPGFGALSTSFKGVLRISGAPVFVTGLRGRYNERGDFLITTTAPVDENATTSASEMVFPQLADGGGFTTQIILFSGTSGQSGSGVLQFSSQSGQPWILNFQ
jgi:hypothetical protein